MINHLNISNNLIKVFLIITYIFVFRERNGLNFIWILKEERFTKK